MPFKSKLPDVDYPKTTAIWDFFFSSPSSPLAKHPPTEIRGYTNCLTKERITYSQVKTHTTHLSTALVKKHNLQKGDTVALFSPNSIWYPVAMLGVFRAGGVVSGASPAYNVEEMTYALRKADAKFLFTVPGSMDVAAKAAELAGLRRENVFLLEGDVDGLVGMQELLDVGKAFGVEGQVESFKIPEGKTSFDVVACLSFSSGTTGLPKAVMIAHQNIIAQCLQVEAYTPKSHTKVLAVLPTFHITGLIHALHLPILINAEVYFLPAFTMKSMLEAIVHYQLNELLIVPPILIRMVRDPIVDQYDLSTVTRFSTGAAPISEEIIHLLEKKFPWTGFKQQYGMTESCSCITGHPPSHYDYKHGHSVGMICASTEIKIVDEDGVELGIGEPGELLARGPQITMGYLNNEKATRETFLEDGWLRTGDQARIDDEGLVTITDRLKELIKVKGIGVAPAELEDFLLGHPKIEDCAVLGVVDDYSGEKPKAFVVAKEGVEVSEGLGREILDYVRGGKVRHKWLGEVQFVESVPKSASGKILRRMLKNGAEGLVVKEVESIRAKL